MDRKTVKDLRNPLTKARDEWVTSAEGKACSAGTTSGSYLSNRLITAFIAGWDARNAKKDSPTGKGRKR